jgi:3'(2'), 5'-bisphosphate nucleotidase
MVLSINTPEMKFALEAVRQASTLVRQVQSELVPSALTKNDRSPVTVADFASQALVDSLLAQAFPDDPMVGEEDSTGLRIPEAQTTLEQVTRFVAGFNPSATPEKVTDWIDRGSAAPANRFWTLDPIDGTKGFLRGEQYAVALALIVDGQVEIGILGCPNLAAGYRPEIGAAGSLVVASRGEGTWLAPFDSEDSFTRLRVSGIDDPKGARVLRSFESGHTNVSQIDQFTRQLAAEVDPVRMDSQAKYAVMAAGRGDLLLRLLSPAKPDYREKIWDQAAGSLVVQEAGGRITDLDGKPLDFTAGRTLANNRGVLASNGHLHTAALQALSAIGA